MHSLHHQVFKREKTKASEVIINMYFVCVKSLLMTRCFTCGIITNKSYTGIDSKC